MNDRSWSFFSVAATLRPTQKTTASQSRPPRRTGVTTVMAVALPSTLAMAPTIREFRPAVALQGSRAARRPLEAWTRAPRGTVGHMADEETEFEALAEGET